MPTLTTKDVRVNGYPSLQLILQHYDALPILIEAVKRNAPEALKEWDIARAITRPPQRLAPLTKHAEHWLNPDDDTPFDKERLALEPSTYAGR